MIIFLGDSFTWGQGLYTKKWIIDGKSIEYCNQHLPPKFSHENISYSDDEYRRNHHFPNLVSKYYDRSYFSKSYNGGSNKNIEFILSNIDEYFKIEAIDFVVVQFTDFTRSLNYNYKLKDDINNFDEFIEKECKMQIDSIHNLLVNNNINNFIFFSWMSDIGEIIKRDYFKNYIPLIYKNIEYTNFYDMINSHRELNLMGDIGISDGHFSELGHRVIADSIIKKIDTMSIDFKRPL